MPDFTSSCLSVPLKQAGSFFHIFLAHTLFRIMDKYINKLKKWNIALGNCIVPKAMGNACANWLWAFQTYRVFSTADFFFLLQRIDLSGSCLSKLSPFVFQNEIYNCDALHAIDKFIMAALREHHLCVN